MTVNDEENMTESIYTKSQSKKISAFHAPSRHRKKAVLLTDSMIHAIGSIREAISS